RRDEGSVQDDGLLQPALRQADTDANFFHPHIPLVEPDVQPPGGQNRYLPRRRAGRDAAVAAGDGNLAARATRYSAHPDGHRVTDELDLLEQLAPGRPSVYPRRLLAPDRPAHLPEPKTDPGIGSGYLAGLAVLVVLGILAVPPVVQGIQQAAANAPQYPDQLAQWYNDLRRQFSFLPALDQQASSPLQDLSGQRG